MRLGQMSDADLVLDGGEQALVEGLVEMPGHQAVVQPLIGAVVEQQTAEQGLFRFKIVRQAGGVSASAERRSVEHRIRINRVNRLRLG